MRRQVTIFAILMLALAGARASADVIPNALFSNGAVLQRGMTVPVWGSARDGEKVTVRFQDQEVSTVANDGKWMVRLKSLQTGGPYVMRISGDNAIEIRNLLVGEVWVCSGQSNMESPLFRVPNADAVVWSSSDPMLRLATVPHTTSTKPEYDETVSWSACRPESSNGFTAVGYFFGRDLRKALKIPVGLIHSSVGGTGAASWMPREVLEANPDFKDVLDVKLPAGMEIYQACGLYNGMIRPMQPYAIRGVIWYQGEANSVEAYKYRTLFPALIRSWRDGWGEGDFPFLFVQLAPFEFAKLYPQFQGPYWAELRESQSITEQKVPNTAMVVTTDVGDPNDIHPKRKEPVGARLALAARAIAYGEKIVYRSPIYKSMKVRRNEATISFTHIDGGLTAKDGDLRGFTIAGSDRKFVPARAVIAGDRVIVKSAEIAHPVAVRFGWENSPDVNLFNGAGLPASPFRTDDFPLISGPK